MPSVRSTVTAWLLVIAGCGADGKSSMDAPIVSGSGAGMGTTAGFAAIGGSTGAAGNLGTAGVLAIAGVGGGSGSTGVAGVTGAAGRSGAAGGGGIGPAGIGGSGGAPIAGVGGVVVPPGGGPAAIPMPSGTCPEFKSGEAMFSVGGTARRAVISMSAAADTKSGPLIVYWYATGSSPSEAQRGLPMSQVLAAGGVVVAPHDVSSGAGTFPWVSNLSMHDALFDEILGCAVQKTKIDTTHIHAVGFSAGALMTTHLSYARSKYLASVATYSGGAAGQFQDPNNKFAVMAMTGGMGNDMVVVDFYAASKQWQQTLKTSGHFALLCDHGGGHSIPSRLVPGVWQFFLDHPFGKSSSPYAGQLPAGIAPPCVE